MDELTVAAYDVDPKGFADAWHTQSDPAEMHELVRRFFHPGAPTADIGCGAGRDTAWLNENGYPAIGYDPSPGLLLEARRRHPGVDFAHDYLPELSSAGEGTFANVLCETVIMHLPVADIAPSVRRLLRLLRPGGILYLSWRVADTCRRDDRGRLYSAVDVARVVDALDGGVIKLSTQYASTSSGASIQTIIAERAN
jgi:SAM-dependent methyltransferase